KLAADWQEDHEMMEAGKYKEGTGRPSWGDDAFETVRATTDQRIPFTDEQLYKAINLKYENDYEGKNDPIVDFDDKKLKEPQWGYDPTPELPLPGVPMVLPHEKLKQDMREAITKSLTDHFNKEAEDEAYKQEPPEGYFDDSIGEMQDQSWDSMKDKSKFEW